MTTIENGSKRPHPMDERTRKVVAACTDALNIPLTPTKNLDQEPVLPSPRPEASQAKKSKRNPFMEFIGKIFIREPRGVVYDSHHARHMADEAVKTQPTQTYAARSEKKQAQPFVLPDIDINHQPTVLELDEVRAWSEAKLVVFCSLAEMLLADSSLHNDISSMTLSSLLEIRQSQYPKINEEEFLKAIKELVKEERITAEEYKGSYLFSLDPSSEEIAFEVLVDRI